MWITRRKNRSALLEWRIRLFGLGGGLGIGGVWLDSSWMIYGALLFLFSGAALRFLGRGDEAADEYDGAAENGDMAPENETPADDS